MVGPVSISGESLFSNRWVKAIGIVLACGVASELVYFAYKRIKRMCCDNAVRNNDQKQFVEEVLFFPDAQIACKEFFVGDGCRRLNCRFTHEHNSLSRLYTFLADAKQSLDVCVFVICCADLGDLLVTAHKNNVRVRVICDDEQIDITGSQIWRLRKEGIPVRTDNSSYLMHHKFVVIDGTHLLTGSFNWTRQAISGNQENLVALRNMRIVSQFSSEFEKLWKEFDPKRYNESSLHRYEDLPVS
ncbi:uncharacterized protein LOC127866075 isoform X2 [Dreissena polymorpha]|nr:uncharacterized protein LOC127866075 isoform X2 [Dreissena polymorpha]